MTRSELINRLYLCMPQWEHRDVEAAVHLIIHEMNQTMGSGGRVEVRGFGAFSLKHHKARNGRNPKTGESLVIPEKFTVHFKPGKALRERVNHSG